MGVVLGFATVTELREGPTSIGSSSRERVFHKEVHKLVSEGVVTRIGTSPPTPVSLLFPC